MKRLVAGAFALSLLLSGSMQVHAQSSEASGLAASSDDGASLPNYESYAGRPEAINCLDMGTQASAQAMLRADPTDPMQLDSDRNGIACEINPEPRDVARVPR
jgi:hypothetical protein